MADGDGGAPGAIGLMSSARRARVRPLALCTGLAAPPGQRGLMNAPAIAIAQDATGRAYDLKSDGFLGGFRVLGHARENELAHVLGLDLGGFGFVHNLREKARDLDRVSDLRKVAGALDQL